MLPKAICSKALREIKIGSAACYCVKHGRSNNCPNNLWEDILNDLTCWKSATCEKAKCDRGVKVAALDVADCVGHGQHRKTKRKGNTNEANPNLRELGS